MQTNVTEKVSAIRSWLDSNNLDAFIVPHEDEYLGEYLPPHNERLKWLTDFSGSAGLAVITRDSAAIFVDGRYTVQVKQQVPSQLFEYLHLIDDPLVKWLKDNLAVGSKVGLDTKVYSTKNYKQLSEQLGESISLVESGINPIDLLWKDRQHIANDQPILMPPELVGLHSEGKCEDLSKILIENQNHAALLTQPDSICWLLNIRGLDIPRLPVILCQALVFADGSVSLFTELNRLTKDFYDHLPASVTVYSPNDLDNQLTLLGDKRVQIDPANTNSYLYLRLIQAGAEVVEDSDPTLVIKAKKNSVEIEGMRQAHIRDGVAMVHFLSYLDQAITKGDNLDESELAAKLKQFRQQDNMLKDLSFDTISATGSNAAMCHYQHTNSEQYGKLFDGSFYLVDSGGQYLDGTTDITRTISVTQPSGEEKMLYTLVLKGHIAIATARFPIGTHGHQIDALARQYLWQYGYDYDHGTGHGVGHFLSVHEGPARISKSASSYPIEAGMILSNEPGYYREGHFGIRLENLELVEERETNGDNSMLNFTSLTRCPIDTKAIDLDLLTPTELNWLNNYHATVRAELSPFLSGHELDWLNSATVPIGMS